MQVELDRFCLFLIRERRGGNKTSMRRTQIKFMTRMRAQGMRHCKQARRRLCSSRRQISGKKQSRPEFEVRVERIVCRNENTIFPVFLNIARREAKTIENSFFTRLFASQQ